MVVLLLEYFNLIDSPLRVFQYISFRSLMAVLSSVTLLLFFGDQMIEKLKSFQYGASNIREDVPERHLQKSGTPSLGGLMIFVSIAISAFLWADFSNMYVCLLMFMYAAFMALGAYDDVCKIKKSKGISAKQKLAIQIVLAAFASYILLGQGFATDLQVPFFKNANIVLPSFVFAGFVAFVLVASSNAVNLTDGLDGLAIGPMLLSCLCYMVFAYFAGHDVFSKYLQIKSVPGSGELVVVLASAVGACLGFLWFNTYPAQIFMGDAGSLSLGALLGMVAVIVKQELLLLLIGGVFVAETLSVIIQVLSFKLTGKRVFKMAPIHHHFELKGLSEPKLIVRFWIVSLMFCLLALASLKLR